MELSLSGNSLKTFARSITCLARVGNELSIQASPSQLGFHTLNTSRSAYQSITLKPEFFDVYTISEPQVQCSVLLKSSLQEITVIATEPTPLPSDDDSEIGGKAVEFRSYIDPTKDDSDTALHTQLWIDPSEEFLQYTHTGDPVDVTFAAFLTFCEGCEVDIHIFFEKAGVPILMAPKFGLDDGSTSDFDVTLVLASMLVSQLHPQNPPECPPAADPETGDRADQGTGSAAQQEGSRACVSEQPSDHTRIWSELSGSAARSGSGVEERQVEPRANPNTNGESLMERVTAMGISNRASAREGTLPGRGDEMDGHGWSQHHPSNWVGPDEDDDEDENDMFVQSTPPY
ncbi:hypothetical protein C5167_000240 [Papaver somniferum]|uniref:Cell cycle checkpoint control protein RAD9A n=1 Tax=Papaver somniferum TaxID=3469 RepID=A0A4Y7KR08_PAPSO|nr:hypothetical protein C5167_000240 [Papaver somniferum]